MNVINIKFTDATSDEECCGNCSHMQYEDADGYGLCNILASAVYCGNVCKFCDPRETINTE